MTTLADEVPFLYPAIREILGASDFPEPTLWGNFSYHTLRSNRREIC